MAGLVQLIVILEVFYALVLKTDGAEGTEVVITEYSFEFGLRPTEFFALTLNLYVSYGMVRPFLMYDVNPPVVDARLIQLFV